MATRPHSGFRFPGGDDRTVCIGATGSGKTTCATWLLAHMRFDKRPWCVIDFKRETLFDDVGSPPLVPIGLNAIPRKRNTCYLLTPRPGDDDALEAWLWKVWEKENIGLFIDEASLMPDCPAWQAILQQGRSKRLPCIICTQRPVMVKRAVFSEASFFAIYRMQDKRDYRIVEGFVPADLSLPLPEHHWRYYDVSRNRLLSMRPVPPPDDVADMLHSALPNNVRPFGNFWRGEGRPTLKRSA